MPPLRSCGAQSFKAKKMDIGARLAEFRQSWESTGCTVMSDGWTDDKGRSLINFLVQCTRGTMFVKSVDASARIKDATLLCELMDGFCYPLICTIVGLAEEPPVDKHDKCLIPVYQMIRLYV